MFVESSICTNSFYFCIFVLFFIKYGVYIRCFVCRGTDWALILLVLCVYVFCFCLSQVLLVQRWYRARSVRHKYQGCIASAVLIQKRVRGMQAREFRLLQEVAAIIIQRCDWWDSVPHELDLRQHRLTAVTAINKIIPTLIAMQVHGVQR